MTHEGEAPEAITRYLDGLVQDPVQAARTEQDRAIFRYALLLTRTPAAVDQSAIDALRAVGLDDRGIHDLCAIVSYFNFVNRMADGLGVELEG